MRSRIVVGGVLTVLVPLVIAGAVIFLNSSRTLESISSLQKQQLALSLSATIRDAVQRELRILEATASDPSIVAAATAGDYPALDTRLADLYLKVGTEYEGLAVFDRAGTIRADGVDTSRIGLSIASRDYFKEARRGRSATGPPTLSMATARPIFGLSAPILARDGTFLGGVLAVVRTDFLVRRVTSVKMGRTGYSFLIDQHGVVIAHPDTRMVLKTDMTRTPGLEAISRRMVLGETGSAAYTYEGRQKIAAFAPVGLMSWSVAVTQDRSETMALVYQNLRLMLAAGGGFVALASLAIFFLSGIISTPVQKSLVVLNQAMEQATDAIIITGLDRKVQFVNPAMAAIVGRPIDDLVGRPPITGLDDEIVESVWRTLERGEVWSSRVQGKRNEGAGFTMDLTVTPVRDHAGQVTSFLGIGRDVTHELMLEEQMRQGQKLEAIGTLAGGIAHDFNNILSAIYGYVELTTLAVQGQEEPTLYQAEILKAASRAKDLVNQILTFSRRTSEGRRRVRLAEVTSDALKLIRASLPTTIAIEESLASDAAVLADPSQLHQIVMNLCANAGYAMKERGGTLSIGVDETDVDEESSAHHPSMSPGRLVRLRVSDTGPGIPAKDLERVFDPFFTTKPQGEGTGLGLSVVHGIVKALGGRITASSEVGKGATFTVFLPIADTDHMVPSEPVQSAGVPGGTGRVLLVDDEETLVRVGKAMLESLGYTVQGFTDSRAAWESFAQAPRDVDAVITDYTMPEMTGFELTGKLRKARPDVPVILCSGYLDAATERAVQAAGINECVRKPMSRAEIAHALHRALGGASARAAGN